MEGWIGRRMLCVVLAGCAWAGACAQTVYRCRGADGTVAYQDRACAATQAQTEIALDPPPPPSDSPDYGRREASARAARTAARGAHARVAAPMRSWECRAADGGVFYRHSKCPKSIAARTGGNGREIRVTAVPIARADACRRLARAGAAGRAGHEHDEAVSTYDRNAGRDPCRYE